MGLYPRVGHHNGLVAVDADWRGWGVLHGWWIDLDVRWRRPVHSGRGFIC